MTRNEEVKHERLGRSPVYHKAVQLLLFLSMREASRAVFFSLFGIRII